MYIAVAGESVYEGLHHDLRQRMLSNGETLLFIEMPIFSRYLPEDAVVRAIQQPVRVLPRTANYVKAQNRS